MALIKKILADLIKCPSITPTDAGCQEYMIDFLEQLGFQCHAFDNLPVRNFYAFIGDAEPLFIFAGHTDVVSIGELSHWNYPPFELTETQDLFYGRGVADMKGSLAAMLAAASRFIKTNPNFKGSLGFLITSGEEGDDFLKGTPYVMEKLHERQIHPKYCIVGEPSSQFIAGDQIRIGRRGSLTANVTIHGKQGHVAYPDLAQNPIHQLAPVLAELTSHMWDEGSDHFPPTSLQITQIQAGNGASNVIPGTLKLQFNIRYSNQHNADSLMAAVDDCFKRHQLHPIIEWIKSGSPFLTTQGKLLDTTKTVLENHSGKPTICSTGGGTSDGRFIAPYGVEVIELGPVNATIHQVNESVPVKDLELLESMYFDICEALLV